MKTLPTLIALILTLGNIHAREPEVQKIPSPNGKYVLINSVIWDNDFPLNDAVLKKGTLELWRYSARTGRPWVFSWSPSSTFVLCGLMQLDRSMTLWVLNIDNADDTIVLNARVDLDSVEDRLIDGIPDNGHYTAGGCSVDWDSIKWHEDTATMTFQTYGFGKNGYADLKVDCSVWPPRSVVLRMEATK